MTRRELWLSILVVFGVALAVRIAAAAVVPFPIPEDTTYYYGVARNLVEGRGLVSDAVWSFQTPPLTIPRAAFEVWMPLPTFLAAVPMAIFGTDYRVAQATAVLVGSLIPVLAWRLTWDAATERGVAVSRRRVLALGAGLTAAVELPLLLHSTLPDSTALFALFILGGCMLIPRLVASPRAATWRAAIRDPRLLALGAVIGLGALTRNEAIWLAGTWFLLVVWAWRHGLDRAAALRLVAVPAVVALAIFAPWIARNLSDLGTPLPSQTITNAFSITGFEIFAFQQPPTLSTYLAAGVGRLIEMRVTGFSHNLLTVLLLPSFPVGVIGLIALPGQGRGRTLQPLLIVSLITFAFTTLVFPVSTTWGTYLHAAGATHVLLIVSCLFALDALIVRVGKVRGWTKPVAWLGPALTIFGAVVFSLVFVPSFGSQSQDVQTRYNAMPATLAASGLPPVERMGPVISDHPIWWADALRAPALGLPDESPSSVLALARTFPGTRYLVLSSKQGRWPDILKDGGPDAACFQEVPLTLPADADAHDALRDTHVYALVCS